MAETRSTVEKWNIANRGRRASGIELLRVLCMVWIIMGHYLGHGVRGAMYGSVPQWSMLITALAYVANNVFFLITGWFIHKTNFSFKKLASLVVQILTVNYVLLLVNVFVFD